jgi:hypothetical protein
MSHLYRHPFLIYALDKNLPLRSGAMFRVCFEESERAIDTICRKGAFNKSYIDPLGLKLLLSKEPRVERYSCGNPFY